VEIKGDNIKITETIFDGFFEKGVECDFIVPDYYPDILKIIFVEAVHRIKGKIIGNDKLTIKGDLEFRVVYYADGDGQIKVLNLPCEFEHSFDVKGINSNSMVKLKVKVENSSCRVLNPRKISVKGIVCLVAKVLENKECETVKEIGSEDFELLTKEIEVYTLNSKAEKILNISEELEINSSMPLVKSLIKTDAVFKTEDIKLLSNKIIIRGTTFIKSLYLSEDDTIEVFENELPFTQIIDVDGVDESCDCEIKYEIDSVNCFKKENKDGENALLTLDLSCNSVANIYKNKSFKAIIDAYNVDYEIKLEKKQLKIVSLIEKKSDSNNNKNSLDFEDSISKIIDIKLEPSISSASLNGMTMVLEGSIEANILAFDLSNNLLSINKTIPLSYSSEIKEKCENMSFEPEIAIEDISYTFISENRIDIRYETLINTVVLGTQKESVVSEIFLDETKPKEKVKALPITLYFAKSGESIWSIAKKYNASQEIVKKANDSENEILLEDKMLLIPRKKY